MFQRDSFCVGVSVIEQQNLDPSFSENMLGECFFQAFFFQVAFMCNLAGWEGFYFKF